MDWPHRNRGVYVESSFFLNNKYEKDNRDTATAVAPIWLRRL